MPLDRRPITGAVHRRRHRFSYIIIVALIVAFFVLAELVSRGITQAWDQATILSLRSGGNIADPIGPAWMEEAGRDVTALGSYIVLVFLVASATGFLALLGRWRLVGLLAASVIGGMVISALLKFGFDRPRPDIPHSARVFTASFPSGHATLSTVVFLVIGGLLTRTTEDPQIRSYFVSLSIILTVAVGFSRLYLGVHYPTDVLVGWLVGGAWALGCWTIASKLEAKSSAVASTRDLR